MIVFLSRLLSVVFHPLLMATYILLILLMVDPYIFGYNSLDQATYLFIIVVVFSFVLPLVSVFLMKQLGFVNSMSLTSKNERIAPIIITAIFYLWLMANTTGSNVFPSIYSQFLLGSIISIFTLLLFNSFFKVSLHTAGVGGILMMVIIIVTSYSGTEIPIVFFENYKTTTKLPMIGFFVVLAGLIGTARLVLNAHTPKEIYLGYSIGAISIFTGYHIYPLFF